MNAEAGQRRYPTVLLFAVFFAALLLLHLPLLHLPYFWDEAGYYVPAARDLLLTGSLIPQSTVSNAHPPLVMAWLAFAWKLFGFHSATTRVAMLLLATFTLLGVFRVAQRVANTEVALASSLCVALYPVFFAQSSLAHLDMPAAGFTIWALLAFVERRKWQTGLWFSLAVLAKETAILAPPALLIWRIMAPRLRGMARLQSLKKEEKELSSRAPQEIRSLLEIKRTADSSHALGARARFRAGRNDKTMAFSQAPQRCCEQPSENWAFASALLFPIVPLAVWYAYHFHRTGFIFGNPEFFRYNVQSTLHPLRIALALGLRLWQILAYMGLYLLTLTTLFAMSLPPLTDNGEERRRISFDVQLSFAAVILAYVLAMAVIGGAVLARYMLPVIPLVVILCVSTLRRRIRYWRIVVTIVCLAFVVGWFVNPPYGFAPEDNLAYRDYILLHERAEQFVVSHYPTARVLTAWPASDELTRPYLGYVSRPFRVFRIEDLTVEQLMAAADMRSRFDVALVFSTKYEPPHAWFRSLHFWEEWKTRFFGYHRDVPPEAAAQLLQGELVYSERRNGQWIGVIEVPQIQEARVR